ncbi:MAG: hypothetical protein JSW11_01435 [Candidatus Heimdallarchaeota archaeon]|nr:MAG: hypothetical protein JSW11_01435 [Candidatus Heimdallarchaeota archaeon]
MNPTTPSILGFTTLLVTRVPLSMFVFDPLSTALLAIPIILNEMVLAVWLIVKGFNSSSVEQDP